MNILTIPLRNVRRKPTKTLLLLLVFTLGVMSIVALYQVSLVVGHSLEKKLTAFGANIVVSPATEKLSVSYGGFHMGDMLFDVHELPQEATVSAIRSIQLQDRISAVAPKLVTMAKVKDTAIAVVGVDWREERGIKSYWAAEGEFPQLPEEVLVGSKVAEKLHIKQGDSVTVLDREFTVSGILYETGADDDTVLFMSLASLQDVLGKSGATSFIEVAALCAGCPIEDIVEQLQAALPGAEITALQHVVNQRMASVNFVQKLALSISVVILITAATMVGVSMLSAVNERKKDIGILRSLGYGKADIFLIFCIEAGFIGGIAGIFGYLIGFGASFKVLEFLAMAEGAKPVFSIEQLLITTTGFIVITVVAAAYPSWKGARVEPSTALVAI
ncbi:ABC transporter permease [Desulfosediminicola flagellatus]|uniref:ABC transporter permease n=1 Tax=Desulfosediminicola flagellatus TaxID=2569541 RepID=UPI0010ABF349|nr:FtsX-like permease family protein [Desulfosediminicola flagellatus]